MLTNTNTETRTCQKCNRVWNNQKIRLRPEAGWTCRFCKIDARLQHWDDEIQGGIGDRFERYKGIVKGVKYGGDGRNYPSQ
jgi:hypothetical protein